MNKNTCEYEGSVNSNIRVLKEFVDHCTQNKTINESSIATTRNLETDKTVASLLYLKRFHAKMNEETKGLRKDLESIKEKYQAINFKIGNFLFKKNLLLEEKLSLQQYPRIYESLDMSFSKDGYEDMSVDTPIPEIDLRNGEDKENSSEEHNHYTQLRKKLLQELEYRKKLALTIQELEKKKNALLEQVLIEKKEWVHFKSSWDSLCQSSENIGRTLGIIGEATKQNNEHGEINEPF